MCFKLAFPLLHPHFLLHKFYDPHTKERGSSSIKIFISFLRLLAKERMKSKKERERESFVNRNTSLGCDAFFKCAWGVFLVERRQKEALFKWKPLRFLGFRAFVPSLQKQMFSLNHQDASGSAGTTREFLSFGANCRWEKSSVELNAERAELDGIKSNSCRLEEVCWAFLLYSAGAGKEIEFA